MPSSRAPELGSAQVFEDSRGRLTLLEFGHFPFTPTRAYVIDAIPLGGRRAGHANRTQHRLLVGIAGAARVTIDDGTGGRTTELRGGTTLHIGPRVWHEIEALDEHVSILVFADAEHDPADQVHDRTAAHTSAA